MKISRVNAAFRSIGQFQIKHRYLILDYKNRMNSDENI